MLFEFKQLLRKIRVEISDRRNALNSEDWLHICTLLCGIITRVAVLLYEYIVPGFTYIKHLLFGKLRGHISTIYSRLLIALVFFVLASAMCFLLGNMPYIAKKKHDVIRGF